MIHLQLFFAVIPNSLHHQGLSNTNMGGDLKVEHENSAFKAALINLAGTEYTKIQWIIFIFLGNYTEDSLQRIAKSMEMARLLEEKLIPHYKNR